MSYLSDSKGKKSHTRLLVVVCVPMLTLLPLFIWAGISVFNRTLVEIPLTITGYLGAANGILLGYAGFKTSQETKGPTTP